MPLPATNKEENFWIRRCSCSFSYALDSQIITMTNKHCPSVSPCHFLIWDDTHSGFGRGNWTCQQRSELSELHVLHVPLILRDPALGIAAGAVAAMVSRCHGKTNLKLPRDPTLPHSHRSKSCDPIHRAVNREMLYQINNPFETETGKHSKIFTQTTHKDEPDMLTYL